MGLLNREQAPIGASLKVTLEQVLAFVVEQPANLASTFTYSASNSGLCLPARSKAERGLKMQKQQDRRGMPRS
jgi:hypothetical protein